MSVCDINRISVQELENFECRLDQEDMDEIVDRIGDIHLCLNLQKSTDVHFEKIQNVLFRYTPSYDHLIDAIESVCAVMNSNTIYNHLDHLDNILSDLITLVIFLHHVGLSEKNRHKTYLPTVLALRQVTAMLQEETQAGEDAFGSEVEFF